MKRSVIRSIVGTLMLTSVALFAFAGPASAKGKPVTITLACTSVASSITVDVQMVSGGALGTPDGSPVSLSCGDSTSGLPSATTVKGLPQIPDGFVYNYTFGPTANSPDGGGSSSSGTRQSVTPIYDTLPAQIGTLTVN